MHLRSAAFLESYHEDDKAVLVYEKILSKLAPLHVETVLRYVALERRRKNYEKCKQLFTTYLESVQEESHKVLLHIHQARFLALVSGPDEARASFNKALELFPNYKALWHAFLTFEKRIAGDDLEARVTAIYERAVHGEHSLSEQEKLVLLREWMEWLMDQGEDIGLFKTLSFQYNDAVSVGDDGQMVGLKRAMEGILNVSAEPVVSSTPVLAPVAAATTTAATGAGVAAAAATDPATMAAYAAYYAQYYGQQGYDSSSYASAGYGSYAGYGYQWPTSGQQ
eukprot:TRINITY_DN2110_c0_g1_i1.p1 TRINITY_DN2110_c0_g1~~TRINITY_DN2110_c0_g1_i1.p1  ORF type:complete len:281 (+),score=48.72 TRINITY_DN2110_c0_g1_i1:1510-2352(+)